ncbi:DNA-binding response regulator [Gemmatimonadetes bacterium T265]|nr:DNA-binding response regulator [Gemmatimonadetes bacterium T265]
MTADGGTAGTGTVGGKSPVRVLVVDDEVPARRRLLELLEGEAQVALAGACAGGRDAVRALDAAARAGQPVDVLFLDVQMPEVDGFAVLDAVAAARGPAALPAVVFVTAYDQYALRAFDAHAADYLLKPYSDARFRAALGRAAGRAHADRAQADGAEAAVRRLEALLADVRRRPVGSAAAPEPPARPPYLDRIVLKTRGRVRLLPVEEVAWIEADDVYVRLHTAGGAAHLHRAPLGELEAALDPRRFVRIHRSAVVNLDYVAELQADSHGAFAVRLRDRTVLTLSRSYRPALEARLGQRL